jgi:hypothetical protein
MIDLERIERRVQGMTEGELLAWLEVAIPGMQRHLEQYQRTRNPDHLGELAIAEMTAGVVVTTLMTRKFPAAVEGDEAAPVPSAPSEPKTDTGTTSARRSFLRGRRAKTGTANAQPETT